MPTIVLLDFKGYLHFVVLKKVADDKVYLGDPALGDRILKIEDFIAGWNGVAFAVIGEGYQEDTPLLTQLEPIGARRLLSTDNDWLGQKAKSGKPSKPSQFRCIKYWSDFCGHRFLIHPY